MRRLFFLICVVGLALLMWYLSAPKGHAQEAKPIPLKVTLAPPAEGRQAIITKISQIQIHDVGHLLVDVDEKGGVTLDKSLRGACSPDRLIAALEAARGFVSESADHQNDIPFSRQKSYLLLGGIKEMDTLAEMRKVEAPPQVIKRQLYIVNTLDGRLTDLEKRQRAAIETFNQVYKECVKSEK